MVGDRPVMLRRYGRGTARCEHPTDAGRALRRAGGRRRHQRGGVGGIARRSRGDRRPRRPGRLRQLHQPGIVEPRVGWVQVPRELRVPAGPFKPVPSRATASRSRLPRQHQAHRVPRRPRPHGSPFPPWLAALGSHRLLDASVSFRTHWPPKLLDADSIRSRPRNRSIDTTQRPRGHRVLRRLPEGQRRPVRVRRSCAPPSTWAPPAANYVELVRRRARRRPLERRRCATSSSGGPEITLLRRKIDHQRRRTLRRRTSTTRLGPVAPTTGSCTPRASTWWCRGSRTTRHERVLAFFDDTQRLFYVIPMGQAGR